MQIDYAGMMEKLERLGIETGRSRHLTTGSSIYNDRNSTTNNQADQYLGKAISFDDPKEWKLFLPEIKTIPKIIHQNKKNQRLQSKSGGAINEVSSPLSVYPRSTCSGGGRLELNVRDDDVSTYPIQEEDDDSEITKLSNSSILVEASAINSNNNSNSNTPNSTRLVATSKSTLSKTTPRRVAGRPVWKKLTPISIQPYHRIKSETDC